MNVTRLFLSAPTGATLTHIRSARSELTRTWQEIRDRVASLARALRAAGVRPGDRILILASSRIEIIECVLAAFSMGAVAMPVSPTTGRTTIQAIVRRMKPACCAFEDTLAPEVLAELSQVGCQLLSFDGKGSSGGIVHDYSEWAGKADCLLDMPSFEDAHPALIIHSSGSSGDPKVIVMGHGALVRHFEYNDLIWAQYADAPDALVATSAMIVGMPLSHLAGIQQSLQSIMNGRAAHLLSFFLPQVYLKLLERTRCAAMLLVPSMYRALLNDPYLPQMDRSALRCCITGGEPCSPELLERIRAAFGVPVATAYSMTECLSGIAHSRREIFAGTIKPGSCGRQLFGEVSLRDAHGVEQSDVGELWIRNPTVHHCYLDPEMNEERLRGGWFRSGDLFMRDADGDFFHRGRVDDMFICNGKNIYPLEMEMLLLGHPHVEAVCAAPIRSEHKGVVPAVLVVSSQPLTSREVQNYFRSNGALHTVPQFVSFASSLPLLSSGKTDRRQATQLLQTAYESAHATAVP